MHPDGDVIGEIGAEFLQHRARLVDRAGPVGFAFIPIGRHAEDGARITGAKGADHHVVKLVGVFDDHQFGVQHGDIEFLNCFGAIGKQTFLEIRIGPGAGDDAGTHILGPGIHKLQLLAHVASLDDALFDQ